MAHHYSEDNLVTPKQHEVNSLILEQASDTAEKLTELECKLHEIKCWETDILGLSDADELVFTDEAQTIFNVYYDEQVEELYKLLQLQLKIIK